MKTIEDFIKWAVELGFNPQAIENLIQNSDGKTPDWFRALAHKVNTEHIDNPKAYVRAAITKNYNLNSYIHKVHLKDKMTL